MMESDPVPIYTQEPECTQDPTNLFTFVAGFDQKLPILQYPQCRPSGSEDDFDIHCQIVNTFYSAIRNRQSELVAMMIESGCVTPETTGQSGQTPLIEAVAHNNVRMVQELVDFGADVNCWGNYDGEKRTPLMVAASVGNLTLVKLFVDVFHANDALIAPDGQLALRLAAEQGWSEVVTFLPSRRGGGFKRWKKHHATAVRRAKKAAKKLYCVGKCLIWHIPKALLWQLPRSLVYGPIKAGLVWCWQNKTEFGPWILRKIKELPGDVQQSLQEIFRWLKTFVTTTIPRFSKSLTKFLWRLMTSTIPTAFKEAGKWALKASIKIYHSLLAAAERVLSLLHTVIVGIATFFRHLTILDIWYGVVGILRAMFVDLPRSIWSLAFSLLRGIDRFLRSCGGALATIIRLLGHFIVRFPAWIVKQVWIIISSFGASLGRGWLEFMIWINPKA